MHKFLLAIAALSSCAHQQPSAPATEDVGFKVVVESQKEIKWSPLDFPLIVYVHPSAVIWYFHLQKAIDVWNKRVGFQLFTLSEDMHEEADIFLRHSPGIIPVFGFEPPKDCPNTKDPVDDCFPHTWQMAYIESGLMASSPIFLPFDRIVVMMPSAYLLAEHELGHALGLDHDPEGLASIMNPTLVMPHRGDDPPITDPDATRIHVWYSQKGPDPWAIPTTTTSK